MIGTENSEVGKAVVERYHALDELRARRRDELASVSRLYRPQRQGFRGGKEHRDDWNLHQLYNSTTLTTASNATASLYSTLCNPANQWLQATTFDKDLANFRDVKLWLDQVTQILLKSLSPAVSNFYGGAVSWTADTGILGTGAMVSDEGGKGPGKRLRDSCVSPADFVFGCDAWNMADELIVERRLTARKLAKQYGIEALPEKLRDKATKPDAPETYLTLQAYQPNPDYVPGQIGKRGAEYLVTHVIADFKTVLRQGFAFEAPFGVPRWDTDGDEAWGRGLGYLNLASAKKLQLQERDNLSAAALAAKPPLGTTGSKAARRNAQLAPGKFLHGAVSYTGQQLVRPIFTFNGLPVTNDMAQRTLEEIEKGWHAALLSLVGRTGLGNLEVIERMEERLRLQAPYVGNFQNQGLAPILKRRFAILFRAGQIPPPPEAMRGQPLDIRFVSVAAQAQKAQEGIAITRVLDDTIKLASAHPDPQQVWDAVDTDYAQAALVEARGAPARLLRSPEEVEALRAERQQAAQAQQALQAAEQGAGIAGDLAGLMPEGAMG